MSYHGTTCKLKIERILAEGMISKERLGVLSGGAVDQDFYTKNFPITHDAAEAGGSGTSVAAGAAGVFDTDLTEADDYWNGMTLRFTAGPQADEMRVITDYAQLNGEITVVPVFTGVPGNDAFVIEPSVNVYSDEGSLGSWGEYDEDGTDYIIAGLTGLVTVFAAENQAGDAGDAVSIDYYTSALVGLGQSMTIDFEGNLTDVYTLGDRDPQEIKEGVKKISGTIDQLYASRDLIGKFLGESDFYERLADFSFYLYPNGETGGQPEIKLSNVKFGGGSITVDVGGLMAANVTWSGLVIAVGTV